MIVSLTDQVRRRGDDILELVRHVLNISFVRFVIMEERRVSGMRILEDVGL